MICLGIESTAHTFGAGIVTDKGKICANEKDSFTSEKEGIHPAKARDHHTQVKDTVVQKALDKAGITSDDIDLVSFSQGPGLPPCLVVGMEKAKSFAQDIQKTLIGVNHCIAHLEIGRKITKAEDPVLLYASGANTQVIAYEGKKYRIFGETLDIGVGNFLDSFARYIGLGFPGGPKLYELAKKSDTYVELPYVVKGMDVSFGGLLTNLKQKYDRGFAKEDLAYSVQETAFAMLIEVTERAMAHCEKTELLLGGGVSCNKRLQKMAQVMCKERGAKIYIPDTQVLVDNGAMIAWQGILEHKKRETEIDIRPNWRTDQVNVTWR